MSDTNRTDGVGPADVTDDDQAAADRRVSSETSSEIVSAPGRMVTERRSVIKAASTLPIALPFRNGPYRDPGQWTGKAQPADDLGVGDTIAVSEILRFSERYRFEVEMRESGEFGFTISGRTVGSDQFIRTEHPNRTMETYLVDGTIYVVSDGRCRKQPDVTTDSQKGGRKFAGPPRGPPDPRAEVTDITPVEGSETLVLELQRRPDDLPMEANKARGERAKGIGVARQLSQPDVIYYVDVDTGYVRRIETESAIIDYHSWGAGDPISVPDLDCRESEIPHLTSDSNGKSR